MRTKQPLRCAALAAALALLAFVPVVDAAQAKKQSLHDMLGQASDMCDRSSQKGGDRHLICDDNTVSFVQPGPKKYDFGACGPTALANAICMQCRVCLHPNAWYRATGMRPGGGTQASDLLVGIENVMRDKDHKRKFKKHCKGYNWEQITISPDGNQITTNRGLGWWLREWEGHTWFLWWEWDAWEQESQAVRSVGGRNVRFNPVMVFLNDHTGESGHVTTVVGVERDGNTLLVIHNTWGKQYRTKWSTFKQLWKYGEFRALVLSPPST